MKLQKLPNRAVLLALARDKTLVELTQPACSVWMGDKNMILNQEHVDWVESFAA